MLKNWVNQNSGMLLCVVWFTWCYYGIQLMTGNNVTAPEWALAAVGGFMLAGSTVAWLVKTTELKKQRRLTSYQITLTNGECVPCFVAVGDSLTGYVVHAENYTKFAGNYNASDLRNAISVSFDLANVQEKKSPATWVILKILDTSGKKQQLVHFEWCGLTQRSFEARLAERDFLLRRTPCMIFFPTVLTSQVCEVFETITNFEKLTSFKSFGMIKLSLYDDLLPAKLFRLHDLIEAQVEDTYDKSRSIVFIFFDETKSRLTRLIFHGSSDLENPENLSIIGKETWIIQIQLVRNAQ